MKRLNRKKLRGGEGRGGEGRPELEPEGRYQKVDSYKYSGDLTTDVIYFQFWCGGGEGAMVFMSHTFTLQTH